MYLKVYIFAVLTIANASILKRSTDLCPLVEPRPDEECQEITPGQVCIMVNQFDPDCDDGAGICCFDGCGNMCATFKTENIHLLETQLPLNCSQSPVECHDKCTDVNKVVQKEVEVDNCETTFVKECGPFAQQICIPTEDEKCPVPAKKTFEECLDQLENECWSPTVHDLDCPNAGLCCFNGCANRCVAPSCVKKSVEECLPVEVQECNDERYQDCTDVGMVVQVPVSTTTCVKIGSACAKMSIPVCKDVTVNECKNNVTKECKTNEIPVAKEVMVNVCKEKIVPECSVVNKKVCNGQSYNPYRCQTVATKECANKAVKVCQDEAQVVINQVKQEICQDVVRQDCQDVVKRQCDEVEKEICTKESEEKCSTAETHNKEQVVFQKCQDATRPVCAVVTKNECQTVFKESCPACFNQTIWNHKCEDVPKEVCTKEIKIVEETVPDQVCSKICEPISTEPDCVESIPNQFAQPVTRGLDDFFTETGDH